MTATGTFRLLEVVDKSQTGPRCKKNDFETKLLPNTLKELIKQYDIRYDPGHPIPADDNLADDLFEAGLELFLDVGILCLDTERLIKFDENEVKTCLKHVIDEVVVGAGNDARRIRRRRIEDPTLPVIFGGPQGGVLTSGRPFVDAITSMVMEPILSMICYGSLREIDGRPVILGSPLELHAARCEAMWMREAAARAGRPGIHLVGSSVESAAAEIANSDPILGYRPTDGRNVSVLSSLKINYNILNKVKHFLDYSTFIYAYYDDFIGGYTLGPEGTAIAAVASHLANTVINQATYQPIGGILHLHYGNQTNRMSLWAMNLVGQSLARKTKIITFGDCVTSAGPCTEMILYEAATHGLSSVSGPNPLGVMSTGAREPDRYTGLEQRFMGEVGYAAARLKREDANELVKQILSRYEQRFESPPIGKTFQECYNLERLRPTEEWSGIYEKVKKELMDIGLDFRCDDSCVG